MGSGGAHGRGGPVQLGSMSRGEACLVTSNALWVMVIWEHPPCPQNDGHITFPQLRWWVVIKYLPCMFWLREVRISIPQQQCSRVLSLLLDSAPETQTRLSILAASNNKATITWHKSIEIFWRTSVLFVWPLILPFLTSGDVCPGLQN